MASVGIRKRVSARTGRVTYQVWWLLDDGSQGAQTVATLAEARELQAEKQLEIARGAWLGRRRGRLTFDRWADEWWSVWSTDPDRSPTTLAATENRLRRHIRPWLGQRTLDAIRPTLIRQWQNQLASQLQARRETQPWLEEWDSYRLGNLAGTAEQVLERLELYAGFGISY